MIGCEYIFCKSILEDAKRNVNRTLVTDGERQRPFTRSNRLCACLLKHCVSVILMRFLHMWSFSHIVLNNCTPPGLLNEHDAQVLQCQVALLVNGDGDENALALHVLTISTQSAISGPTLTSGITQQTEVQVSYRKRPVSKRCRL